MFFLEKSVEEVLFILKDGGKSVVIGGYFRDQYFNKKEKDVDVLTTCNFDFLLDKFPELEWSDSGLDRGLCRVSRDGKLFEFSIVSDVDFNSELMNRDLTINTIYHNGVEPFANNEALSDLDNNILRGIEPINDHFKVRPKSIIRPFRFCSYFGSSIDDTLLRCIENQRHLLNNVPEQELIDEAYEILKGPYVLKSFKYMISTGILDGVFIDDSYLDTRIPFYGDSLVGRLTYVDYLFGADTTDSFIETFNISKDFVDRIDDNRHVFEAKHISECKSPKSTSIILKRYQLNDDKDGIRRFLSL